MSKTTRLRRTSDDGIGRATDAELAWDVLVFNADQECFLGIDLFDVLGQVVQLRSSEGMKPRDMHWDREPFDR